MNFPYLVRPAQIAPSASSPLLILLHGKGADESDLFALARHLDPRLTVLSLRAPHEIAPGYYRWYERFDTPQGSVFDEAEIRASLDWLLEALDQACHQFGTPADKVHLLGFSQGAAMALSLALRIPQQLSSVISIAGRILPGALTQSAAPEALQHLGLFLMHGSEDDLVPASESSRASAHFTACGLTHEFRQYAAGHTISPAMFKDLLSYLSERLDRSCTG